MQRLATELPTALGEITTLRMSGVPCGARLEIKTPGGSVITVPMPPHADVTLLAGGDAGSLVFTVSVEESPAGLRLVGGAGG